MPVVAAGAAALAGATVYAGGVAAAFASSSALVVFAAKVGTSLILSGIAQELAPDPEIPDLGGQDSVDPSRNVTVRQPLMSREVVYGRVRKGGKVVYIDTNNPANPDRNDYLDLVIVVAWKRVKSIGKVYFDGKLAFDADGNVTPFYAADEDSSGNYANIQKKLGTDNQTAFTLPADRTKWTSQHRLLGCPAIALRMLYDPDRFPNGIPNITVDVEGRDQIQTATNVFEHTRLSAHCVADFLADPDFGLGLQRDTDNGYDASSQATAAVICEENVSKLGGGIENRYECNGIVDCSRSRRETLRDMLRSMAGWAVHRSGRWHIYAGAYEPPSVTLTADDAREAGLRVQTRVSRASNFNAVRGTFFSPENDWQPDSFPSITSSVYEAEDGGERTYKDVRMPFVTSASQAQRVAKIILRTARQQQRVAFSGKLSAFRAAAGENALLTYDRWGYSAKPFFVEGVALRVQDGALVCDLDMKETSPLVFDWDVSEEQVYAAAPRTNLPSRLSPAPPGVPSLEEVVYVTRAGTSVKVRIEAAWVPSPSPYVRVYDVEARRLEDIDGVATGEDWVALGATEGATARLDDVAPGFWEVAVRGRTHFGVTTDWKTSAKTKVSGLSEPPSALTGLRIQSAGGLAFLRWDQSGDVDVRIGGAVEIRHSASAAAGWPIARSLDVVPGAAAAATVPLLPGTYLVRARDSSGLYGPAASADASGAQVLAFANVASLTEDTTFPGTKTDLSVDAGELTLTDPAASATGFYEFQSAMDFGSVKRVRLRSEVEFVTELVADNWFARPNWFNGSDNWFGGDVEGLDVLVEARTTQDDPAGAPTWTEWAPAESTEVEARGVEWRATLTSDSANKNLRVRVLRAHADEVT